MSSRSQRAPVRAHLARPSVSSAPRKRTFRLEPLEDRVLFAVDVRSFDGTGNNLTNTTWGSAGADLLRTAPAEYGDGKSTPAGADRASARLISDLVAAQNGDIINNRDLSAFIYAWGQFLDHDIDQTITGTANEKLPISVPTGDPWFDPASTGTQTIPLTRSLFDSATGTSTSNPRQQINSITAFIDGSQIYGSDATRAAALRTLSGGHLKTSEGNMLPYNTGGLTNDNALGAPVGSLYLAGDTRANENIELTSVQTLFVREHNRLADKLAAAHPTWNDEQVFQQARRLVIGELQAITYNEFLPALLGKALPAYSGYKPNVNPGIANEFSTAAFRLGHSLLGDDVEFFNNVGVETHDPTALRDDFFNPVLVSETGIDPILKYLASDRAQELDTHVVDEVRNFLFGAPGQGGLDLPSLNIQRGRDHGLADYNTTRVAYGLPAVTSFAQISSNPETQAALKQAYGNVNNIDLWVGGLAEDHVRGGSVGALFSRILIDQFTRLRDGDRFWYQRDLTGSDLQFVQGSKLSDIISRNTTTTNLQDNVFFFHTTVSGVAFIDLNGDGRQGRGEMSLSGLEMELVDEDGNVLATTKTDRSGRYTFNEMELGTYQIRMTLPRLLTHMTRDSVITRSVTMTRGQEITLNFGVRLTAWH
jgi:peroxidase